jgi:hypothetical protein
MTGKGGILMFLKRGKSHLLCQGFCGGSVHFLWKKIMRIPIKIEDISY